MVSGSLVQKVSARHRLSGSSKFSLKGGGLSIPYYRVDLNWIVFEPRKRLEISKKL
jgi:hypothetical protein